MRYKIFKPSRLLFIMFIVLLVLPFTLFSGQDAWIKICPFTGKIAAICQDPITPSTIYVAAEGAGIYKSLDRGNSWAAINNGLTDLYIGHIVINPINPEIIYASSSTYVSGPSSHLRLFKTIDGGNNWSELTIGDLSWQVGLGCLAIDPLIPSTIYVVVFQRHTTAYLYKSSDGGETWEYANLSTGVYSPILALAIDPKTSSTIYAGGYESFNGYYPSLYKTEDAGKNWKGIQTDIDFNFLLINPQMTSIIYAGTYSKGVYKSLDGGNTWNETSSSLANLSVSSLAIDPGIPSTIYAGTHGGGVFKSISSGNSWIPINTGLTNLDVYALAIDPGNPQLIYAGTADGLFSMVFSSPWIGLSRDKLFFGASAGNKVTQSQKAFITNYGEGTLIWEARCDQDWISVVPSSGTGDGQIEVSVDPSGLAEGTYTGTITISDPNASNSPQTIAVELKVYGAISASSPPFGWFDTPVDGTGGIEGSLPVTGWALDDIEVTKVDIWRDPVGGEPVHPNGYVYIGDAVFVEGARPDVETAYPAYPLNYRAGWGYMMLTNFLPNSGSGTFRIHAIAYDEEGHSMKIGTKTITCDNAHATLPFGTIDTPSPGGTVSGNAYVNFGWALTPVPKSIPTDGSTILLWIDGLPVGHPTYNNYRVDIATLFPGYANSNGAVGYYYIDTTQYVNGVHTIAWSVVDSAGTPCGIGSRYFTVMNTGGGSAADFGILSPFSLSLQSKDSYISSTEELADIPTDFYSPAYVRKGYNPEALPEPIYPDVKGVMNIEAQEVDRIEIALRESADGETLMDRTRGREKSARVSANKSDRTRDQGKSAEMSDQNYVGYLIVGNQLRPMPIGSTIDAQRGIFSWQLGPGFVGEYNFVFMTQDRSGIKNKKNIRVRILPAYSIIKR